MTGPVGLLPYGSADSSVIFRRNFLAVPTAAGTALGDVGTCTVNTAGTGGTYTSAGLVNSTGNFNSITQINGSSAAMAALAGGGQIYYEVETAMPIWLRIPLRRSLGPLEGLGQHR